MTTRNSHEAIIFQTISIFVGDPDLKIARDTRLEEELDFDSTELISVIVDIEQSMSTTLKGIKYCQMKTVGDVVDGVDAFLAERDPTLTPA